MSKTLISNPPYNMKWDIPPFAQMQPRFQDCGVVPPESNANYAFVLTGIENHDRCIFLLPTGVLTSNQRQERNIRGWLTEQNLIDAVIICPDHMFESTDIGTCILVLDKNKKTVLIEMVDLRGMYDEEVREQRGQYGGASKEKRVYKKTIKTISSETMNDAISAIQEKKNVPGLCKAVTIEDIACADYTLAASYYIDVCQGENRHREYADIVRDLNYIIKEKNACKLTINESLGKSMGLDTDLFRQHIDFTDVNKLLTDLGADSIEREDYFTATKNKNEIKFENGSKDVLSSVLMMIMSTWKHHIFYLNQEENRYLAELRDALLPDLMSGKVGLKEKHE